MGATGFFKHSPQIVAKVEQPKSLVYVGTEAESACRAVAAALVDNVLAHPNAHRAVLARLSQSGDRVRQMARNPQVLAKLIAELANSLKQIAIDETLANPEYYFVGEQGEIKLMNLCESGTLDGRDAIAALDKVLLPIELRERASKDELPLLHRSANVDAVQVHILQDRFLASVRDPARFKALGETRLTLYPVDSQATVPEQDVSAIQLQVRRKKEELIKSYGQNLRRLDTMLTAGELSREQLLSAYIEGLGNQQASAYRHVAHGSQAFFDELLNQGKPFSWQASDTRRFSHEEQLGRELVQALARGISLGQIDEDRVFEPVERQSRNAPAA